MATSMNQTGIPFILMRGGTSRGPYFRRDHLPQDRDTLARVLIAALGAGHPLNIDGIGGGAAVTTKVAMLDRSGDVAADIDYLFAQVAVEQRLVDFKPTCGNILAGVGPAAIEMGLIKAADPVTDIRIRAVNTGAVIIARIQTPNRQPAYQGTTEIAGVPGMAAPVELAFTRIVGGATGALLPTGKPCERIDNIEVTCIDAAMPMVIALARDFGITGHESAAELDANQPLFDRIEAIRLEAAQRMGMGDARQSVTPKFGLIAPARHQGDFAARYFMPWKTHPSMAVTGAQCLAACALAPRTIASNLVEPAKSSPATIAIEHPSGSINIQADFSAGNGFELNSTSLTRTARKLAEGTLYIPNNIWPGPNKTSPNKT